MKEAEGNGLGGSSVQAPSDQRGRGVMRSVAKNSLLNIVTQAFVMALTFLAIPHILKGLGDTSFGILSLVLVFIGYFSLIDLGVGRAVVKFVADRRSEEDIEGLTSIFTFSCVISIAIGVVAGLAIFLSAGGLASLLFKVPGGTAVILTCVKIVAVMMPFMILQSVLRGILMGYERFDVFNTLQALSGTMQWGGILVLVLFHIGLIGIVMFVAAVRVIITVLHFIYALKVSGVRGLGRPLGRRMIRELLGFGGWVMVSQVVSPVLQYLERFVLSATIATSILPFYVIPFEATSKLVILATAIAAALFPSLSGLGSTVGVKEEFNRVYAVSLKAIVYVMIPIGVVLITYAKELLSVWITPSFAGASLGCFQILVVAFVLNSIAQIPYTTLHASGRPDLTGVFHLIELPVHVAVVFIAVKLWGVEGAAFATLGRMILDTTLLFWASEKKLKLQSLLRAPLKKGIVLPVLASLAWVSGELLAANTVSAKVIISVAGMGLYFLLVYKLLRIGGEWNGVVGSILRWRKV